MSKPSVQRAYDRGETPESLENFLSHMSPGGLESVPQSLRYLITDTYRASETSTSTVARKTSTIPLVSAPMLADGTAWEAAEGETVADLRSLLEMRINSRSEDGTDDLDTAVIRDIQDIRDCLKKAYTNEEAVRIHFVDEDGALHQEWMEIVLYDATGVVGIVADSGRKLSIPLSRIAGAEHRSSPR